MTPHLASFIMASFRSRLVLTPPTALGLARSGFWCLPGGMRQVNPGSSTLGEANLAEVIMCVHQPRCAGALAPDRMAAHIVASHPEQGWSLLCNGIVVFEDAGALLPDGRVLDPRASGTLPGRVLVAVE
jgi:hypothetical protein